MPSSRKSFAVVDRRSERERSVRERDGAIAVPGRNCWCVLPSDRAAVLIDGAAYFAQLESALRQAQRSILIVGWDFDGRVRLRQDAGPDESPPLGALLRSLVEANCDLVIHILVWSASIVHAPSSPEELAFGADWQDHTRIQLRLDTRHPIYAAHHQKVVCIDDHVAFVGGIDLTRARGSIQRSLIFPQLALGRRNILAMRRL